MSEASDMLAGTPPAAPPGDGGTPPAAPPADPNTPPAPPAWLDGLDDDSRKFVEAKGFKSPADALAALKGYAPPESADKYEIPVPEGEDPSFAKAIAPIFHKAGLSAAQAKALAEGWNEMQAAQKASAVQQEEASARERDALLGREKEELKREWGADFDKNSEIVRRAWKVGAEAAGITVEQMDEFATELGNKIGFAKMFKIFEGYGRHFQEDQAHGLGRGSPSPVQSALRIYDKSNMNP